MPLTRGCSRLARGVPTCKRISGDFVPQVQQVLDNSRNRRIAGGAFAMEM